jgi:sterol desaturase/sphingolipid hydroxylase (fatty acid hydroxylase superfamily)
MHQSLFHQSFLYYGFVFFGVILAGYFLVAGGMYRLFYSALAQVFANRKLHRSPPLKQAIRRDISLSTRSAIVFAVAAAFILTQYESGKTLLYVDFSSNSLWYLGASFGGVLMLQDTYFYFTHRLFHHPRLFKRLHQGHHRSGDPTPWTSFAFDLPEAIVQALFLVGIVFVIPLHFITLVAVLMTMTISSVINHLGFELFSPSAPCAWLGKGLIASTHHAIHHRKYKVHYGLYFTFWDRLLGTEEPIYEQSNLPNPSLPNPSLHSLVEDQKISQFDRF